jgi:4-hydroxyacetophenone monooxygenase
MMSSVLPITEDDAFIRAALEGAEIPALLLALAHATGDLSILRADLRPDPSDLLGAQGGLSENQLAAARELALDVLRRFRDEGSMAAPPPGPEALRQMIDFAAGTVMGESDVPFLAAQLGLEGDGPAGGWHKADVAPDVDFHVVVIGAGISGLASAYRLQQAGIDYVVLEKDADVGGTWHENIYPGCRVDVANHLFSYSFAQRSDWPEHFSSQPVLQEYLRDVASDEGLVKQVQFQTEVLSAAFSDGEGLWKLRVRRVDGTEETLEANVVISAVGQLNRPSYPSIPGREDFHGPSFHSARWQPGVDLAGQTVGVMGTGATAVQLIPVVAELAKEVVVFQRTPPWLAPTPDYHDGVSEGQQWLLRHVPSYAEWYRFWLFCTYAEGLLPSVRVDPEWPQGGSSVSADNELVRQGLVEYLQEQFADRPDLLGQVVPSYPPAAKRMLRDNGIWARTLKRDNVRLITDRISRITADGVATEAGDCPLDVLIFATGFQASRFLMPMTVKGRGGLDLHEQWGGDARAYLGMTVPGFPNLFCLYGPNTNIVVNGSIIFFSECSINYVMDSIRQLLTDNRRTMECRPDVFWDYNREIDEANHGMAWGASDVNSWYKNELGRVSQNWPYTLREYWQRTKQVRRSDFVFG